MLHYNLALALIMSPWQHLEISMLGGELFIIVTFSVNTLYWSGIWHFVPDRYLEEDLVFQVIYNILGGNWRLWVKKPMFWWNLLPNPDKTHSGQKMVGESGDFL